MPRIIFLAPYPRIKPLVLQAAADLGMNDVELHIVENEGVDYLQHARFDGDAIIARGSTLDILRQRQPPAAPIIELRVTGYDVLRAIFRCRAEYAPRKIALIGAGNMIHGVQNITDMLDMELSYSLHVHEDDTLAQIMRSRAEGAEVIVGGAMAVLFARRLGMPALLIESGMESLRQALEEAVHVAQVARRERVRAEQMRTVLNATGEGLLAVDEQGIISLCNEAAGNMLGVDSQSAQGRPVQEIFPTSHLESVLAEGQQEQGPVQGYHNALLMENARPVLSNGQLSGAVSTLQRAEQLQDMESQVRRKIHRSGYRARYCLGDYLGSSASVQDLLSTATHYAAVDSNILILGETGTGKEILAQGIHSASARHAQPFVPVNCAALPESLLESALFGYVSGAFTGASRQGQAGLFEQAHGGTIFLDEVSEIPMDLQGRLLRILQEQEVMRLGDDRVLPVNVRVIAASNKNLKLQAQAERFRPDLLYRLDVLTLKTPSLRERREDIAFIAERFLREYARRFRKGEPCLAPEALALLQSQNWAGNVRELRNVCERLMVLAVDPHLDTADVRRALGDDIPPRPAAQAAPPSAATLASVLQRCGNNRSAAARELGVSRVTLWRWMRGLQKRA